MPNIRKRVTQFAIYLNTLDQLILKLDSVIQLSYFLIKYNHNCSYYKSHNFYTYHNIMASLLTGLLKRVIKVRIEGNINQKLTDSVTEGFRRARFFYPEAVVVVVNSVGGSLAQAKHISDIIKNYGARNNVPIYCFAEDHCMGSANLILTTGVKSFANQMTMLGDFNYSWSSLWFRKFAEKYNMKIDYVYSGQNKVKFNPFEQIKPQSQKWMQNYLYLLEHDLKCTVIDQRQKHFTKKQLDKNQLQQKIFKNPLIQPQQAVKVGLIDGIMNVDEMLNSTLSGAKVHEINKRSQFDKLRRGMELFRIAQ